MNSDSYKQKQPLVGPHANLLENNSTGMQKSNMDTQKKWI